MPPRPVRLRRTRLRAVPYLGALLLGGVACSMLIDHVDSLLDLSGQRSSRRRMSGGFDGETCEESRLGSFERDNTEMVLGIYVPVILYMFLGLAVVCDDFFTDSIEVICEELQLSEDVAGATFMAAGGSAPELFTSLLTVFTTQSSAGVGTILGSAVFNLVVIIALSALATEEDLFVDYRPIVRDSVAYAISIVMMAVFALTPISADEASCSSALAGSEEVLFRNESADAAVCAAAGSEDGLCSYRDGLCTATLNGESGFSLIEAVVMTFAYLVYVAAMSKNEDLMACIGEPLEDVTDDPEVGTANPTHRDDRYSRSLSQFKRAVDTVTVARAFAGNAWDKLAQMDEQTASGLVTECLLKSDVVIIGESNDDTAEAKKLFAGMKIVGGQESMLRRAVFCLTVEVLPDRRADELAEYFQMHVGSDVYPHIYVGGHYIGGWQELQKGIARDDGHSLRELLVSYLSECNGLSKQAMEERDAAAEQQSSGVLDVVLAALTCPLRQAMKMTIPPCTQQRHRKYYPLAFGMSIAWIAFLCLWMVLLAEKVGCILGVNSFLMGLVVLAAGTSVPDALASIAVARDGYGGMAVSNAIGSNVFDM
jgi:Ca2+/Na+ antiporter